VSLAYASEVRGSLWSERKEHSEIANKIESFFIES
jgi:hypothetical protein